MNVQRSKRSILKETVQSGLPTWAGGSGGALALSDTLRECERFFYNAFSDCTLPVMLYGAQGERLVQPVATDAQTHFPDRIDVLADPVTNPHFGMTSGGLMYIYPHLDRWPLAPDAVTFIAVRVDHDWFGSCTDADLTPSEFTLVGLLLAGHDLASAAKHVGASYDTKRKQIRGVLEKAQASGQAGLLREISLSLSAYILEDILRPDQRSPEIELSQRVYGRDVAIHSLTVGSFRNVPVWEFGAPRGQPILYFHSMLAPMMFTTEMVTQLKAHNLRLLMIPRHFFNQRPDAGSAQRQILQAASEVVQYFCDDPVICIGESAGCAWAGQFAQLYPEQVSEVIFAATPQAVRPQDITATLSRSMSLLNEVSTHIRRDERVIAGLTRVYNAIARVPVLARRSLDFMLRQSPADQASINAAFDTLALDTWVQLIANKAARSSIDEVSHLHSDWVRNLYKIERPMQFFHGAEDPLCPVEDAQAMVDTIPNAQFTTFEDAGHLVLGQRLSEILAALFVDQKSNEKVTAQSVYDVS